MAGINTKINAWGKTNQLSGGMLKFSTKQKKKIVHGVTATMVKLKARPITIKK